MGDPIEIIIQRLLNLITLMSALAVGVENYKFELIFQMYFCICQYE